MTTECWECDGTGNCPACEGSGLEIDYDGFVERCEECRGRGSCGHCRGKGKREEDEDAAGA